MPHVTAPTTDFPLGWCVLETLERRGWSAAAPATSIRRRGLIRRLAKMNRFYSPLLFAVSPFSPEEFHCARVRSGLPEVLVRLNLAGIRSFVWGTTTIATKGDQKTFFPPPRSSCTPSGGSINDKHRERAVKCGASERRFAPRYFSFQRQNTFNRGLRRQTCIMLSP